MASEVKSDGGEAPVEVKPEEKENGEGIEEEDAGGEVGEGGKGDEVEEEVVESKEEEEEEEEEGGESKKRKRSRKGSSKKELEDSNKGESESEKVSEKEPITPSSDRPTRERKIVERYSIPLVRSSANKPLTIEKGLGTQLKDIPNVAFKLSKRKPDDNLQLLHTILFGKKAKVHTLKKNIGLFSGYVWIENEEKQKAKVRERIDKCVKEKLMDFCDVLNIAINKNNVKKEELSAKLLEFLESPHATTESLLADTEKKPRQRKRKVSASKDVSPGEASKDIPTKKLSPQVGGKRKPASKGEDEDENDDNIESPEAKDDSSEDADDDMVRKEESDDKDTKPEEEKEPKPQISSKKGSSKKIVLESSGANSNEKSKPAKKVTPAKSTKAPAKSTKKSSGSPLEKPTDADGTSNSHSKPKGSASKKQKVEKETPKDQSVSQKAKDSGKKQTSKKPVKNPPKDQAKGKSSKKAKAEPTRAELYEVVVDILKEVDFNKATLSDILRQLGTHFGVDLMNRKAEVKDIITDVINNMSDEEDEEEEAGNNSDSDDGEDTEKDDA